MDRYRSQSFSPSERRIARAVLSVSVPLLLLGYIWALPDGRCVPYTSGTPELCQDRTFHPSAATFGFWRDAARPETYVNGLLVTSRRPLGPEYIKQAERDSGTTESAVIHFRPGELPRWQRKGLAGVFPAERVDECWNSIILPGVSTSTHGSMYVDFLVLEGGLVIDHSGEMRTLIAYDAIPLGTLLDASPDSAVVEAQGIGRAYSLEVDDSVHSFIGALPRDASLDRAHDWAVAFLEGQPPQVDESRRLGPMKVIR